MTIKQQGGIFGRNPTFNDVTLNDLTVAGEVNGTTIPTGANLARTDASQTFSAMQTFSGSLPAIFSRPNAGNLSVYWSTTGLDWVVSAHSDGYWRVQVDGVGDALRIDGATRDVSVSAGNLVMANGKGIDFSATAGTGTSELFDDYEEGTWTPSLAFGTDVVLASATGTYTKMGRLVYVTFNIDVTSHTQPDSSPISINGLPYNIAADIGTLFSIDPLASTFVDLTTTPLGGIKTSANTFLQLYQTDRSAIAYTEAAASGKLVGAAMYEAS